MQYRNQNTSRHGRITLPFNLPLYRNISIRYRHNRGTAAQQKRITCGRVKSGWLGSKFGIEMTTNVYAGRLSISAGFITIGHAWHHTRHRPQAGCVTNRPTAASHCVQNPIQILSKKTSYLGRIHLLLSLRRMPVPSASIPTYFASKNARNVSNTRSKHNALAGRAVVSQ